MTVFKKFAADYTNKKVLIFGLGLQGRGLGDTKILAEIGAQVTVTDKKTESELQSSLDQLSKFDIEYQLGGTEEHTILNADVIIRNASVPWNHPLLELARENSIPIKMDAALFFEYAEKAKTIGITGTRGKSTTTQMVYDLLKSNHLNPIKAGNSVPIASLELLKDFDPTAWYIFELSSWQLQAFHREKISPHIAVLTNYYPDHLLDRSYQEYIQDKTAIFAYQSETDFLIANQDNSDVQKVIQDVGSKLMSFSSADLPSDFLKNVYGQHNLENAAAAQKVAQILKLKDTSALDNFPGIPFRQELVREKDGISIINDTTSTTPIATIKALEAFPQSILIIGGTTKHLPIDELIETINTQAKKVILLAGTGTDEISDKLNQDLISGEYTHLDSAVQQAWVQAEAGDTILLSPGFTSFGMFENEFDRGEQFNRLAEQL